MGQWEWLARNARYTGEDEWTYLTYTLELLSGGSWDVYDGQLIELVDVEWDFVLDFITNN